MLILKFFSLIILIKRYLDTHKRKLKQLNLKKNEENENETSKDYFWKEKKKEIKRKEKARSREYYRMLLATMEKKETATYATLV